LSIPKLAASTLFVVLLAISFTINGQRPVNGEHENAFNVRWTLPVRQPEQGVNRTQIGISEDGKRILVAYSREAVVLDENASILASVKTFEYPGVAAITRDGQVVVVSRTIEDSQVALVWFSVTTNQVLRSVTLSPPFGVSQLAMSANGRVVVLSGTNYAFNATVIEARDNQGNLMWKHIDPFRDYRLSRSIFESSVTVSGDGKLVAAARRELVIGTSKSGPTFGTNNGIVLFNGRGEVLWNFTTGQPVGYGGYANGDIGITGDGEYLGAAGFFNIYEFTSDGHPIWVDSGGPEYSGGQIAFSEESHRFVAGRYDGTVYLGNEKGPYWQTNFAAQVQSVAISENGNLSAILIAKSGEHVLYLLNDQGLQLSSISFPDTYIGSEQLAVAGDGSAVVVTFLFDNVYYIKRNPGIVISRTSTGTPALPPTEAQPSGIDNSTLALLAVMILAVLVATGVIITKKNVAS